MTPGRYVRIVKGTFVCQSADLRSVIAHLHDLSRHLEQLIPDDTTFDNLLRSSDFAGGFATRAAHEREARLAVLEALATRPSGHPYAPLRIDGYSFEQVESIVYRLWREGLVDAHSGTPQQVQPAELTSKGFAYLERALIKSGAATGRQTTRTFAKVSARKGGGR